MTKLITLKKEDVCYNWLDYHSIGHFIKGLIEFIFLSLLGIFSPLLCLLIVFMLGLIFEIIENSLLIPIKFEGRKDSVENSLMDILLVALGGITEYFFFLCSNEMNLILNIGLFVVIISLYIKIKNKTLE